MKIAFVWTGLTSYMADCWRRLAAEPNLSVKVWIDASAPIARSVDFDSTRIMTGIDFEMARCGDSLTTARRIASWRPDALFVVGWHNELCRTVVMLPELKTVPKICCFDMPWRWQFRCLAAPLFLYAFLRHYRAAFVPGRLCARYARWLGFGKIHTGLFAIDVEKFHSPASSATRETAPYFLYVGRNAPEKRIADLRRAHALYREKGGRLELRLYGKGLEGGFADPAHVPALMRGAAAFVLASVFDPWPLVLLEAMSAGCPVIASDRCTNRPELGRNWHVFPAGDVQALANALTDAEHRFLSTHSAEAERRRREENLTLARQYDCGAWVERVKAIVTEVRT